MPFRIETSDDARRSFLSLQPKIKEQEHITDQSIDLICLDPPFNSKRDSPYRP